MANTFDATWVKKYLSKGQAFPVGFPVFGDAVAPLPQDRTVEGELIVHPRSVFLPEGEEVPYHRYWGTLKLWGEIGAYRDDVVLCYISFENQQTFLRSEYQQKYPGVPLPAQPDLGYTEEEIANYHTYRL